MIAVRMVAYAEITPEYANSEPLLGVIDHVARQQCPPGYTLGQLQITHAEDGVGKLACWDVLPNRTAS